MALQRLQRGNGGGGWVLGPGKRPRESHLGSMIQQPKSQKELTTPGQFVMSVRDWALPAPQDYLAQLLPSCKDVLWRCDMVHTVPLSQKISGTLFSGMWLSVPRFITTITFHLNLPNESKGWSKINTVFEIHIFGKLGHSTFLDW